MSTTNPTAISDVIINSFSIVKNILIKALAAPFMFFYHLPQWVKWVLILLMILLGIVIVRYIYRNRYEYLTVVH